MLSVAEAQAIVWQHAQALPPESVALSPAVLGQVLGEDVTSDIDVPPYDKAMMDGYAVRTEDLRAGRRVLAVIEEVMAGRMPQQAVGPGQATRIMTGAPIPAGADAVVQIEQTRLIDGKQVEIAQAEATPRQHILDRAREMRKGEVVLSAGTVLRPQTLGILATVGRTVVRLHPRPRVAILPTGDEVVEASQVPGPGQIRNGNGPMIAGQVQRAGAAPHYLGIARDQLDSLQPMIADGLQAPVLVLSGGVSAGKLDLVPGVLKELGVETHFHHVKMKPGKPMLFGTRGSTLVFGLPGNPVSSLVCFELFVRPALRRLMGHAKPKTNLAMVPLAADFEYRTDRPTYYPAKLEMGEEGCRVRPIPWFGSADLRGVAEANGFMLIAAGEQRFSAGQDVAFLHCDCQE